MTYADCPRCAPRGVILHDDCPRCGNTRTVDTEAMTADPYAAEPCGCSLLDGRCDRHATMVRAIHEVWLHGSREAMLTLWSLSDGYGIAGFVPAQGYDWSGIRDSSTPAVEAMFAALHA